MLCTCYEARFCNRNASTLCNINIACRLEMVINIVINMLYERYRVLLHYCNVITLYAINITWLSRKLHSHCYKYVMLRLHNFYT